MCAERNSDVDKTVFTWLCEQRANKVPLFGKVLQQKAPYFASMLGHDNFKAGASWLSCLQVRHNMWPV